MHVIQNFFGPNYFFWSALKVPLSDFIQNMSQAPSMCLKQWMKVNKLDYFHFRPQDGNNQPYPLLLIKLDLKLPSEVTPGLLVVQIQFQAVWDMLLTVTPSCSIFTVFEFWKKDVQLSWLSISMLIIAKFVSKALHIKRIKWHPFNRDRG